jgi:aspartate aminotransferase-like enzyme
MNAADALLLNPGPVTLTDRVRGALAASDVCHREREFAELTLDVKRRLETVYAGASSYEAVLLTGSGTAAVEAMFGSLVPRTARCWSFRTACMASASRRSCARTDARSRCCSRSGPRAWT